MCVNVHTRLLLCHIKNRAPVAYLISPCHHQLLLPHISGIVFVDSPPVALPVLAASSPTPARVGRTTGERSQFRLSQTENMEIRRRTVTPLHPKPPSTPPPTPPVSASCHSLTDKLTFRGVLCPFQSEFIEGDFDLLHAAAAVVPPSVTLIAWRPLWRERHGS